LSEEPQKLPFDPAKAANTEYPITTFQPLYYVADSFRAAQEQVREWATKNLERPFAVRYNPYTQSIEILDTPQKIGHAVRNMKTELETIIEALSKLE
jgi:phenylalanine-4-hydroxylase